MDNTNNGAAFTVRQLSELFGKSEDTIRRWKNEGIGKGDDNIRLEAIENEDAFGRRTSRHLTFTRSAVRDFVRANPFLMDDAPALREFMEREEKALTVIALPERIETVRGEVAARQREPDEEEHEFPPHGSAFHRFFESIDDCDDEFATDEEAEADETDDAGEDEDDLFDARTRARAGARRRPHFDDESADAESDEERRKRYDEETLRYMLNLLRSREAECRSEMASIHQASTIFYRRRDLAEAMDDRGYYISGLVREREQQLDNELEKIRASIRALERKLW